MADPGKRGVCDIHLGRMLPVTCSTERRGGAATELFLSGRPTRLPLPVGRRAGMISGDDHFEGKRGAGWLVRVELGFRGVEG